MSAGDEKFTEADLGPSVEERRAALRANVERAATAVGVLAASLTIGGMIALGACAAPFVFRIAPAPFSGDAMGAAFARFDQIAIGAAAVMLATEVVRTWAAGRRGRTLAARARRMAAILVALSASYIGLALTPAINDLHRAGARRGQDEEGERLDRIHRRAEAVGKAEVFLAMAFVGLSVFTLGGRSRDEDDEEDAPAPLPPGPRDPAP